MFVRLLFAELKRNDTRVRGAELREDDGGSADERPAAAGGSRIPRQAGKR